MVYILYNTINTIKGQEMACSMERRSITWTGVHIACRVAGVKDCRLLIANVASPRKFGARPKGRKKWLYVSTSHTSTMYFIIIIFPGCRVQGCVSVLEETRRMLEAVLMCFQHYGSLGTFAYT